MAKKKGKRRSIQPDYKREISDENFEQLLAESFKPVRSVEIGDEVEATVIGFDSEYVFLDLGSRLDGMLRRSALSEGENQKLAEGQTFTVFVTSKKKGTWECSLRLGGGDTSGEDTQTRAVLMVLEDAYNRNLPVEGKVTEVIRGGFEVQVMGLKAFCPISQIDKQYCKNPDEYLNQTHTFVITRFEEGVENIVLSRREYLQHEAKKRAEAFWEKIEEGSVYEGTVTSIRDFGVFIDIGGIDGLLHISEISYERIENIGEVFKVGQILDVAVKSIDRDRRKIALSLKSLMDDPWVAAVKKLSSGGEFKGKVMRMKTFGVFVQLFPGVEGMVHVSRLGTDRRHQHPKEVLKIGDIVTVRVLEIDEANRKISLTMEKEEPDRTEDLKRLRKEQDRKVKSTPTHMSNLFDKALKKDKK